MLITIQFESYSIRLRIPLSTQFKSFFNRENESIYVVDGILIEYCLNCVMSRVSFILNLRINNYS